MIQRKELIARCLVLLTSGALASAAVSACSDSSGSSPWPEPPPAGDAGDSGGPDAGDVDGSKPDVEVPDEAPTVVSQFPANGDTNGDVFSVIQAEFSKPVTLGASAVTVLVNDEPIEVRRVALSGRSRAG